MAQPDYVIERCLCINGVPEDVQVDEILANFTGILDVHNPRSGKLVVLFNSEQAARLQLQKTPEVILKHGRTPNVGLKVNVCDVSDIKASWLYHSQPMEDQESVYANTATSEESIYQNVAHLRADNGQTYDRNHGINPNQKQNLMDTSVNPPPPDPGQYVPGWGQYPNTSQGYFGQPGYQQPGPGQSTYANQDGNQQNPHVTNPSQLPHGPWYTGFPPSFPPGMVFPTPGGMQCGKDQQELLQFNPWGLMAPAYGGQMPYAPNTGQGSSYPNQQVPWYPPNFVPQHPEQLQYGSPPPHESGAVSHSEHQTEVKSAESNTRSDDSLENALLPKQVVKEQIQEKPIRKIKVTKLPEGTTEDTLKNFFENRRRNGGGPIEGIEYHPATSSAIIEFQEAEAVERVLQKVPLLFLKKQISVEEYVEAVEDIDNGEVEPSCRTIEVCGFAENTEEEVLEIYFENTKRSGGDEVTSVVIEDGVAFVTFKDEKVARRVAGRKHIVADCTLDVKLYAPPKHKSVQKNSWTTSKEPEESVPHCTIEVRGVTSNIVGVKFDNKEENEIAYITYESEEVREKGYDDELSSDFAEGTQCTENNALTKETKGEPIRMIKVTKLPDGAVEETLINYFENVRRKGVGPIESVDYHPETSSAIIKFQEADAVDRVLKKRPLLFLNKQISVEEYMEKVEADEEEEEQPCCTIEVHGFAENTGEDVLEMYFENSKRSGGGEVTSVVFEDGVALVTFTDENAASNVCEREHTLGGCKLKVSLHLPKKNCSAVEAEEAEVPVCTIEVRGYNVDSEGTIELYFESTKRSGGDEIVNFEPFNSDGVIFITFASQEVTRRVLERQHVVAGCRLDVKLYEPPTYKSQIYSKWPEEPESHRVIVVRGVTKNILESVPLYFENKRRSGGDEIIKFEYKEDKEMAYITYESKEVAQRVVAHGKHILKGQPLKVKLFLPPQPRPFYEDRFLLMKLTDKITPNRLTLFLEAKIGQSPAELLFGEDGEKAIIRYEKKIEFEKLEEACKKHPLEGCYLVPATVLVSNCIIISNLNITTTGDTVQLYFENEKRSWGGPVEKVEFKREEKYCLVYFEDHMICDRVMQRRHKIEGSVLQVSIYYECLRCTSDNNGSSFKIPKRIKLDGLEFAKMQFVMKSKLNRTTVEKQLQDCYTQIQWPQSETDCTTLTCTLTSDVQDCKNKALTWAKQAEQKLLDFLKDIIVYEHRIFPEYFEKFLHNLQNFWILKPDYATFVIKFEDFSVQFVAHNSEANDIVGIIKKAQADFDRNRKQIRRRGPEQVSNLFNEQRSYFKK